MMQLTLLVEGFAHIFANLEILSFTILGTTLGLLMGAIPGLSGTVAIALLIPITYYMDPWSAIIMVYAISKGSTYGGSITAILLNTPGTPAAACTQLDGYPLTKQGKQVKALKVAVIASALADFASDLVLIFFTIYLARVVLAFGPVQITAILFFSFTAIGSLTGKSTIKGLMSVLVGLLLSTIGLDIITGFPRFNFGIIYLRGGLNLIPILIGVFIVSEILVQAGQKNISSKKTTIAPISSRPEDSRVSFEEFKSISPDIIRSSVIGTVLGMMPGIGAAITPWIGYGQAKLASKNPDEFGKGSIRGVAAAEAANNAVCGANLIPLLTLGIPGSTDAALIMGVFLLHGLRLGPRIFIEYGNLVYGIFAGGLIAILTYFLIGFFFANPIGKLVSIIPSKYIFPFILVITFMGTYIVRNNLLDTAVMVIFGIIGYFMRKYNFSCPALVMAFMLGNRFEQELRRALIISRGNVSIFFTDPISLVFILIGMALIIVTLVQGRKKKLQETEQA